ELYRRVTMGRLAEVLGEEALPVDRRFLTLGLRARAASAWAATSPQARVALERYAAGVNAVFAATSGWRRPPEFQALGVDPAPWSPLDSLAVAELLAWRLAENHQAELVRFALARRFGDAAATRLAGRYPASAPAVMPAAVPGVAGRAPAGPPSRGGAVDVVARAGAGAAPVAYPRGLEWLEPSAPRGNSNNWVLAGSRTASRRPILANDPHLAIEMPSTWYELHLVAAGLDVTGVSVPGSPFVVIGHNQRVAWGFTNTGADVQDLSLVRFDVAGRRYWRDGAWVPVEVESAAIPVAGRPAPAPFEIWRTDRGTVFAEVGEDGDTAPAWLTPGDQPAGERQAFVLRWLEPGTSAASALDALDRADGWDGFLAAIEQLGSPSQNVVYADVDGNIGYAMSGVLPVRAEGDGTRPAGPSSSPGWTGTVPPSRLPRVLNPAAGYVTSSNNEIDRAWPGLITRDWIAPFRATRLHDVLGATEGADLDTMAALQNDLRSVAADRVLAGAAAAAARGRASGGEARAAEVLGQLAAWDRVVDGRPVVALYEAFEAALWRRTFADEMGEPLFARFYAWAGAERFAGLHVVLADPADRWFDDIGTVDRRETLEDLMPLAALDALDVLAARPGGETGAAWDRLHAARFAHPLGASGALASWLFDRGPVPLPGDGTTVMRVSWDRARPFAAWEHPSWRQLVDVGDWDLSRVVLPAGQSGHPLSPHYFDQNADWAAGRYRRQPFSREAVEAARAHRLVLNP
ncbi:MAG: penicillin acylase family protein, partial [Vicinamibacterales bacterium]